MFLEPGQDWSPNTSWVAPPSERLSWEDCSAIGNYVAAAARGLNQRFDQIPVNTTVAFARSLVPADWPFSPPSPATLLIWAWSWQNATSPDHEITGKAWSFTYTCAREVCEQLEVEGDPDLAGIGVSLASYILINNCFSNDIFPDDVYLLPSGNNVNSVPSHIGLSRIRHVQQKLPPG